MGHHHDRQPRQAPAVRLGFRQREELVGADRYRRNVELLELDGVMDTPRRAGASVADRGHDSVAIASELLREVGGLRRFLAQPEKVADTQPFRQVPLHETEQDIGVFLVVGKQTDGRVRTPARDAASGAPTAPRIRRKGSSLPCWESLCESGKENHTCRCQVIHLRPTHPAHTIDNHRTGAGWLNPTVRRNARSNVYVVVAPATVADRPMR